MNATKPALTAADLFVLLDREFLRRRRRECASCVIQLPYPIDGPDRNSGGWDIDMPGRCSAGCVEVFEELVTEFQGLYDLRRGEENPRT